MPNFNVMSKTEKKRFDDSTIPQFFLCNSKKKFSIYDFFPSLFWRFISKTHLFSASAVPATGAFSSSEALGTNNDLSIDPFSPMAQNQLSDFDLLRNEIEGSSNVKTNNGNGNGNGGKFFFLSYSLKEKGNSNGNSAKHQKLKYY